VTPPSEPLIPRAPIAYALATLSGLLYFLSFPGPALWPLAFVALVPLMVALRGQKPRRAAGLGWMAGFTMTMTGFYWLLGMLQAFSGFPWPLCLVLMALLNAYQGGRFALLGWISGRAEQRGWPFGVVFALGFGASEFLYPLLFPWHFAAAIYKLPALTQLAEVGNVVLVSLMLVAANLAIAELVVARLRHVRPRWRVVAGLAAVPALAAVYGAIRIHQVDAAVAAAPKARVGLVQANMGLLAKRKEKRAGLLRHLRLTKELQEAGPLDLVVWSETSVMSAMEESLVPTMYPMQFTRQLGVPAIFGGVLVRPVDDTREYVLFNSALATDKDGKVIGRYDKQYLLAFGEYLPLGDRFPILYDWSPQSGKFSPGKSLQPLRVAGRQVAVFICYEDIIPGFVNSIVGNGSPDLLVNMTNDAWFGDTTQPWIHFSLSTFRAIEHRRYFIRSTNSGVSAFVDPVGRVVSHTDTFKEQALAHEIAWMQAKTPYELYGDLPWWLVSAAAIGMSFIRRPARKPKVEPSPATDVTDGQAAS
jgi:apolipoprotein N-acyltransferase